VSADTAAKTLTVPETVEVPGKAILAVLALMEAYEAVCAELSTCSSIESFESIQEDDCYELRRALRGGRDDDEAFDWGFRVTEKPARSYAKRIRKNVGREDAFLLAKVSRQIDDLGRRVIGVPWDDALGRWTYHYAAAISGPGKPGQSGLLEDYSDAD